MATQKTTPESEAFGARVKELREARGWTQPYVARKLAWITKTTWTAQKVAHLEAGRIRHPSIALTRALTALFDVAADDLIWAQDPPIDTGR